MYWIKTIIDGFYPAFSQLSIAIPETKTRRIITPQKRVVPGCPSSNVSNELHVDNDRKVDPGIIAGHNVRQRLGHAQDIGKEVLHPEIGCRLLGLSCFDLIKSSITP